MLVFRAHTMALAKSRTIAHQLRIETGRYQKLEDKDRIGLLCNSGEMESEIQFLMDYSNLSEKKGLCFNFVQKYYYLKF